MFEPEAVRLATDYIVEEDGTPTYVGAAWGYAHTGPEGAELDCPAAAHEFYDGWGEEAEWVHPEILVGAVVTDANIENGDAIDDAEPGNTIYWRVTADPVAALAPLGLNQIRVWPIGPPRCTRWVMHPTGRVLVSPNGSRETEYDLHIDGESVGIYAEQEAYAALAAVERERVTMWQAGHPEYRAPHRADDEDEGRP